jgi:hypothetical protein
VKGILCNCGGKALDRVWDETLGEYVDEIDHDTTCDATYRIMELLRNKELDGKIQPK